MSADTPARLEPVACTGCDRALVRAFEFLGKRWSGVVIGSLIHGPAGYRELSRAIDGISDSVLSDRLSALTAGGRVSPPVDGGPPLSVAYALTERGRALIPALEALGRWADEHLPAATETPAA